MEEVESTFSKPPIYYKDFDSPSFVPSPPPPMKGDFWSFGVVRNINSPLPDYVNRQWEPLYDKSKYAENGPQKADDIKDLLHRLMRVCIQFLKNIDKEGEDVIQTNLGELQLVASNMVRLLNMMRTYQLREELIHGLRIQIKEKREMMEEVQKQIDEAKDVLKKSMETLHTVSQTNLSSDDQETLKSLLKELESMRQDPV
ncbi:hypothetical protein WA538_005016, partial [Blastocystis sp. DL]